MSGAWRYVDVAWQETPGPWSPLPCQACYQAPGTVAVYEGLVWQRTLCTGCGAVHREAHTTQLELFEGRNTPCPEDGTHT